LPRELTRPRVVADNRGKSLCSVREHLQNIFCRFRFLKRIRKEVFVLLLSGCQARAPVETKTWLDRNICVELSFHFDVIKIHGRTHLFFVLFCFHASTICKIHSERLMEIYNEILENKFLLWDSKSGWPDWANFRLLGYSLLWAVLWKLQK
jgi:hypothetical protein